MESLSSQQRELVVHTLRQIRSAIIDLREWNKNVSSMEELMLSSDGMQRLAGNCMLIQAIGEGFKQIDKRTEGRLLPMRSDIPWRQIMGMRDRISHGYFEIDTDYIDDVIHNDLEILLDATNYLIDVSESVK